MKKVDTKKAMIWVLIAGMTLTSFAAILQAFA